MIIKKILLADLMKVVKCIDIFTHIRLFLRYKLDKIHLVHNPVHIRGFSSIVLTEID
jgi:hypothetical protein